MAKTASAKKGRSVKTRPLKRGDAVSKGMPTVALRKVAKRKVLAKRATLKGSKSTALKSKQKKDTSVAADTEDSDTASVTSARLRRSNAADNDTTASKSSPDAEDGKGIKKQKNKGNADRSDSAAATTRLSRSSSSNSLSSKQSARKKTPLGKGKAQKTVPANQGIVKYLTLQKPGTPTKSLASGKKATTTQLGKKEPGILVKNDTVSPKKPVTEVASSPDLIPSESRSRTKAGFISKEDSPSEEVTSSRRSRATINAAAKDEKIKLDSALEDEEDDVVGEEEDEAEDHEDEECVTGSIASEDSAMDVKELRASEPGDLEEEIDSLDGCLDVQKLTRKNVNNLDILEGDSRKRLRSGSPASQKSMKSCGDFKKGPKGKTLANARYLTRSDSAGRILRNGKRSKVKTLSMFEGIIAETSKRKKGPLGLLKGEDDRIEDSRSDFSDEQSSIFSESDSSSFIDTPSKFRSNELDDKMDLEENSLSNDEEELPANSANSPPGPKRPKTMGKDSFPDSESVDDLQEKATTGIHLPQSSSMPATPTPLSPVSLVVNNIPTKKLMDTNSNLCAPNTIQVKENRKPDTNKSMDNILNDIHTDWDTDGEENKEEKDYVRNAPVTMKSPREAKDGRSSFDELLLSSTPQVVKENEITKQWIAPCKMPLTPVRTPPSVDGEYLKADLKIDKAEKNEKLFKEELSNIVPDPPSVQRSPKKIPEPIVIKPVEMNGFADSVDYVAKKTTKIDFELLRRRTKRSMSLNMDPAEKAPQSQNHRILTVEPNKLQGVRELFWTVKAVREPILPRGLKCGDKLPPKTPESLQSIALSSAGKSLAEFSKDGLPLSLKPADGSSVTALSASSPIALPMKLMSGTLKESPSFSSTTTSAKDPSLPDSGRKSSSNLASGKEDVPSIAGSLPEENASTSVKEASGITPTPMQTGVSVKLNSVLPSVEDTCKVNAVAILLLQAPGLKPASTVPTMEESASAISVKTPVRENSVNHDPPVPNSFVEPTPRKASEERSSTPDCVHTPAKSPKMTPDKYQFEEDLDESFHLRWTPTKEECEEQDRIRDSDDKNTASICSTTESLKAGNVKPQDTRGGKEEEESEKVSTASRQICPGPVESENVAEKLDSQVSDVDIPREGRESDVEPTVKTQEEPSDASESDQSPESSKLQEKKHQAVSDVSTKQADTAKITEEEDPPNREENSCSVVSNTVDSCRVKEVFEEPLPGTKEDACPISEALQTEKTTVGDGNGEETEIIISTVGKSGQDELDDEHQSREQNEDSQSLEETEPVIEGVSADLKEVTGVKDVIDVKDGAVSKEVMDSKDTTEGREVTEEREELEVEATAKSKDEAVAEVKDIAKTVLEQNAKCEPEDKAKSEAELQSESDSVATVQADTATEGEAKGLVEEDTETLETVLNDTEQLLNEINESSAYLVPGQTGQNRGDGIPIEKNLTEERADILEAPRNSANEKVRIETENVALSDQVSRSVEYTPDEVPGSGLDTSKVEVKMPILAISESVNVESTVLVEAPVVPPLLSPRLEADVERLHLDLDMGNIERKRREITEEEQSPEKRAIKEQVLSSLGLQSKWSVAAAAAAATTSGRHGKRRSQDGVTPSSGRLKTVIKVPKENQRDRKNDRKPLRMVFKNGKPYPGGFEDIPPEVREAEADSTVRLEGNNCSDVSSSCLLNGSDCAPNSSTFTTDIPALMTVSEAEGKGKPDANLVIPEKSSSFSIHPGRLCSDVCSYCFGKFGSLDTPCHVAQLKSRERQMKIMSVETHLALDSCLCDACIRYVDRKANCPIAKPPTSHRRETKSRFEGSMSTCSVTSCAQPARHSLRKKWYIKIRKSVMKKCPIDLDLAHQHLPLPLCAEHYSYMEYFMVCGLCKRRLSRGHMYNLSNTREINICLESDGIPARLSDKLFVCKLCRYYATLRVKHPRGHFTLSANQKEFFNSYRKRILRNHDIEVSDSEGGGEDPQIPSDNIPAEENAALTFSQTPLSVPVTASVSAPAPATSTPAEALPESTPVQTEENLPKGKRRRAKSNPVPPGETDSSDVPRKKSRSSAENTGKSKEKDNAGSRAGSRERDTSVPTTGSEHANISPVAHPKTTKGSSKSKPKQSAEPSHTAAMEWVRKGLPPFYPGEDELALHGKFQFQFDDVPSDGREWEKCTSTLQFDKETKRLWQELQRPYGSQSSFLRHLVLMERYWRQGELVLAADASARATSYTRSVQNRLKAYGATFVVKSPAELPKLSINQTPLTQPAASLPVLPPQPLPQATPAVREAPSSPAVGTVLTAAAAAAAVAAVHTNCAPQPLGQTTSASTITTTVPTVSTVTISTKPKPQPSQSKAHQTLQKLPPQAAQNVSQAAQHKPQPSQPKTQTAQVKPQQAQVKPQQAQVKPQQAQVKPQQAQVKPQQAQVKPQQAQSKPQPVQSKDQSPSSKPQAVLKPLTVQVKQTVPKPPVSAASQSKISATTWEPVQHSSGRAHFIPMIPMSAPVVNLTRSISLTAVPSSPASVPDHHPITTDAVTISRPARSPATSSQLSVSSSRGSSGGFVSILPAPPTSRLSPQSGNVPASITPIYTSQPLTTTTLTSSAAMTVTSSAGSPLPMPCPSGIRLETKSGNANQGKVHVTAGGKSFSLTIAQFRKLQALRQQRQMDQQRKMRRLASKPVKERRLSGTTITPILSSSAKDLEVVDVSDVDNEGNQGFVPMICDVRSGDQAKAMWDEGMRTSEGLSERSSMVEITPVVKQNSKIAAEILPKIPRALTVTQISGDSPPTSLALPLPGSSSVTITRQNCQSSASKPLQVTSPALDIFPN